jgi:hypothetical protein
MNKGLIFFLLMFVANQLFSQMKVGSNPKVIKTNTYFEIESLSGKRFVVSKDSAKVGVGIDSASHRLHIVDSVQDPIRIYGLKSGSTTDSILVITNGGLVRRVNTNSIKKEPWLDAATNTEASSNTQNIYQMGRVGIGNINPRNNLVVRGVNNQPSAFGADQTNAIFRVEGNSNHSLDFGTLEDVPYGSYIQSHNKTSTSGLPLSLNPMGGSIGIGTVNPTNTLHVVSSANPLRLTGLSIGSSNDSILTITDSGVVRKLSASKLASSNEPWFKKTANVGATSNTDTVYIMGNVGVGTNNPQNNLVVKGLNNNPSALGTFQSNAIFRIDGNSNHSLDFGTLENTPYGSYVQSHNKTSTTRLPLSLNPMGGSIGIGTVNPTNTIHVVSSANPIRLTGLQTGATFDSLLTVNDSGVVRRIKMSDIASGGGSWNNVATTSAATSNTQDIYQMGKVGIGTTSPSTSAILELTATDKALLLPRVANTAAIASPVNGMLIYDNSTNCIKGYENGAWTNCYSSGGTSATVVQDCNTNGLQGNFYNGQALSGTSYSVRITNNSFSSATIAFAAADVVLSGVSSGLTVGTPTGSPALTSGSITLVAGQSVVVTYPITGTPASKGTLSAKWTKLALTCTKTTAVVNAPPTINCNGATITTNNYNLIKDSTYSGSIAIPYTVTGGGDAYPAETITSNGITFTRNAGTYTAPSGTITYSFTGTFTGTTNSVFTINTDSYAGGCAIVIFDAIRGALAQGGCTSCSAYDAAAVNAWVHISANEYAQVALIAGSNRYVANDTYMNGTPQTGFFDNGTGVSLTMSTSGQTQVAANNFIVAFSIKTGPFSGAISNNLKLKSSITSISSGYSDVGTFVTAPSSSTSNTRYYWVRKRPTTTVGTSAAFIGCYHRGGSSMVGLLNVGACHSNSGDVNAFPATTTTHTPFIQVIGTPTKQW